MKGVWEVDPPADMWRRWRYRSAAPALPYFIEGGRLWEEAAGRTALVSPCPIYVGGRTVQTRACPSHIEIVLLRRGTVEARMVALDEITVENIGIASAFKTPEQLVSDKYRVRRYVEWALATYAETIPAFHPDNPLGSMRPDGEPLHQVYFLQAENHLIKIGTTGDIRTRYQGLLSQSAVNLSLLCTISGGRDLEGQLHKRFENHRCHGEWFRPHAELLDYISVIRQ